MEGSQEAAAGMEELMGLCSGQFGRESSRKDVQCHKPSLTVTPFNILKKSQKARKSNYLNGAMDDNGHLFSVGPLFKQQKKVFYTHGEGNESSWQWLGSSDVHICLVPCACISCVKLESVKSEAIWFLSSFVCGVTVAWKRGLCPKLCTLLFIVP